MTYTKENEGNADMIQTGEHLTNEIDEILFNKQFICEAVVKMKEDTKTTDLGQSDFVASVFTIEDIIDILNNNQFYKPLQDDTEEIISELRKEKAKGKSSVDELSVRLQNVIAVLKTLRDGHRMTGS